MGGVTAFPWEGKAAMRKFVAPAMVGIGAFLLIAGILALVWAPGAVKKTPLDVNTVTLLSGEAQKFDPELGKMAASRPIYAQSITRVDSAASTDDTAVWAQWSCVAFGAGGECMDRDEPNVVLVPDDQLVGAPSGTVFGSDRVTAEGVKVEDLPKDARADEATTTVGLVNKFPFDSQKKDYTYWDGTIGEGVPAKFDRTEKVKGHEAYVYTVEVTKKTIEIAENTMGTYSDLKEIYVDPATGSILNQTEQQQRWLEDGTQALDLSIGFTDQQVASNVEDAKSNGRSLTLITTVVPLVGLIGGALLVVGGLLLARVRGGSRKSEGAERPLVSA